MSPRTDAEQIREELDTSESDLSDSIGEKLARRAHSLVEQRLGKTIEDVEDETLEDLETLVGAHFAVARVTGAATGEQVTQVQQESAQVTFNGTDADDAAGLSYWEQAVMLDPTGKLAERQTAPDVVGVR
jgi:hypothetical protein